MLNFFPTAAAVARGAFSRAEAVNALATLSLTLYLNARHLSGPDYDLGVNDWSLQRWCDEVCQQYCAIVNQAGHESVKQVPLLLEVIDAACGLQKLEIVK